MQQWFVYILECADGTLYTGVTTDLTRRLAEHNGERAGGARYTRHRRPVSLSYNEVCSDRASACRREYQIKQLSAEQKRMLSETDSD